MQDQLNLNINLTHITFESNRTKCDCGENTVRIFKNRKNEKGVIGVYFDSKKGPLVCISYKRACKSCNNNFYHGYYCNFKGDYILENVSDDNPYHLTCMTYFDTALFQEYNLWANDDGVGYESFVAKYNYRFEKEINGIANKLRILNQTLGRRNSVEPLLTSQRFQDAFNIHFLQMQLQKRNTPFTISKHIFEKVQLMQDMKITLKILKKGKQILYITCNTLRLKKPKLTNIDTIGVTLCVFLENARSHKWSDVFECLWNIHHTMVQQQISEYFQYVPVKNGYPAVGWFSSYGDCNMHIKRQLCYFPTHLANLQKKMTHTHSIDKILGKCKNSPLKANQYTTQYNCCLEHSYMLHQCELHLNDINDFCWYYNAIDTINRTKSDSVKQKWMSKVNTIPSVKQAYFQELNNKICKLLGENSNENKAQLSHIQNIIIEESMNDTTINDLRSCRKGENIAKPKYGTSAGTMCFMNSAGAIVFLAEVPIRETPTFVIYQLYKSFTQNKSLIDYYQRLECLGIKKYVRYFFVCICSYNIHICCIVL